VLVKLPLDAASVAAGTRELRRIGEEGARVRATIDVDPSSML
jgi:hypothetical protein